MKHACIVCDNKRCQFRRAMCRACEESESEEMMSAARCYICTTIMDSDGDCVCQVCQDFIFAAPHQLTPYLDDQQKAMVRETVRRSLLDKQKELRDQPKPCPNCGGRTLDVTTQDKHSAMQCIGCGLRGPWHRGTPREMTARQYWDALPRRGQT